MTKTNEQHAEVKDEPRDRFSSDLETLKDSFTQLRGDVTRLLDNTLGTGKSGVGLLKDRASTVAIDLKDRVGDLEGRGVDSLDRLGRKISESPLLSAAIAMGIGYVMARVFTLRR